MTKADQIQQLIDVVLQYQQDAVEEIGKRLSFVQSSFSFSSVVSAAEDEARSLVESEASRIVADILGD